MSEKKESKATSGYVITRSNLKPLGKITLPALDEVNDSMWEDLLKLSDALTPDKSEEVSSDEFIRTQAKIAGRFIKKYGSWDFKELAYDDFLVALEKRGEMPTNFRYWLHANFKQYIALVTDPNDLAIS